MTCPCFERIQFKLATFRKDAQSVSGKYAQRIEAFQEGIQSGAEELAIRHLIRAGVYWASLDHNMNRNPSVHMILESLGEHIAIEEPSLNTIFGLARSSAIEQGIIDEPKVMLRKILKRTGPQTPALLKAQAQNEINACKKALNQVEVVREKLAIWKEGIIVQNNPEAICIVDIHGES